MAAPKAQKGGEGVRPDNFASRSAELHTEAGCLLSRGEPVSWSGIKEHVTAEGHFRAALSFRESIFEEIRELPGVDPDWVACRGNVALARVNLARALSLAGKRGEAAAELAAAAAVFGENVPGSHLHVETEVALASLLSTVEAYERAGGLLEAHLAELEELETGEAESRGGGGGGKGSPVAADFLKTVQADLAEARGWARELLKNRGLALLEALPFSRASFDSVLAGYRGLLAAGGREAEGDLSLAHAFAGFLLARPTGPPAEDVSLAEEVLRRALAASPPSHPDVADASFNLGVITHLRAVAGRLI
jgi:hypothetical protein